MQIENNNISTILVKDNFSIIGKPSKYILNKESGDTVTVKSLSNIRKLANLEPIKTVDQYFNSLASSLNVSGTFNYSTLLGAKKTSELLIDL